MVGGDGLRHGVRLAVAAVVSVSAGDRFSLRPAQRS